MAELQGEERNRVIGIFLHQYNALHGTNYSYDQTLKPSDPACDFEFVHPENSRTRLKVQHTRAGSDEYTERQRPREVEEFVRRNLEPMLRLRRVAGYSVHVTVSTLPKDRNGRLEVADVLWRAVGHAIDSPPPPENYRLMERFDDHDLAGYYDRLRPHIKKLAVYKVEGSQEPAYLSWGDDQSGVAIDSERRAVMALNRKSLRLRGAAADLVLLIHYDVMPYDEKIDLPEIQRAIREERVPFREVWVVSDWLNPQPMAHRVWPD